MERVHHISKVSLKWQADNKIFNLDSEYLHIHNVSKKSDISDFKNQTKLTTDSSVGFKAQQDLNRTS